MMEKKMIDEFLMHVENQLYTEESSVEIKEELKDHIESLKEDYGHAGYSELEATKKALKDMGDPREIGFAFTDFDLQRYYHKIMVTLKVMSFSLLVIIFTWGTMFTGETFFEALPQWLNFMLLLFIYGSGTYSFGYSSRFLNLSTEPVMILWPAKKRLAWEYLVVLLVFSPIILFLLFALVMDAFEGGGGYIPVIMITLACILMIYSEKYRVPKYMVVNEGLLVKGNLVSWASITGYSFQKDYMRKDSQHHRLILESNATTDFAMKEKKVVDVNARQKAYLQEILRRKVYGI